MRRIPLPLTTHAPARAFALSGVFAVAALLFAGPAGAQPTPTVSTADAISHSVAALEREVLALVQLDDFDGAVPQRLIKVHDEWASSLAGLDTAGLISWVQTADQQGQTALDELRAAGITPSPPVATALGLLSPADLASLDDGHRIDIPAGVYADALTDLDRLSSDPSSRSFASHFQQSTNQRPAGTVSQSSSRFAAQNNRPSTPAATVAAAPPTTTPPADHAVPWPAVAGGAALALVLAIVAARRRGPRASEGESVASLLDAARRLGASLDSTLVARIAVEQAMELTRADGAVFVAVDDGVASVRHESQIGLVAAEHLDRGVIRRVLDTGHPWRGIVTDDTFTRGACAVVVVPVLCSARVVGALCVVRRRVEGSFRAEDQDLMCQLASLVAGALDAALVHDGITELTLTDGLTSLANRRRLDRDLSIALADGLLPVGFLMIDIDHFKTYNDTNGHIAGDVALRQVAAILAANARPNDVVYRYGGEEFCVLLADASVEDATLVAERLRAAVEEGVFDGAQSQPGGRITISVGLALADRSDPREIKQRADAALYEAKHRGRNRVEVSTDS